MKSLRRAFFMLRRNRKEAMSLVRTMTLSIALLFLFFNLQDTSFTVLPVEGESSPDTMVLMLFIGVIAAICALNCFIANTYFLKAKGKELCVYLSCGMNMVALAKYLFMQNLILIVVSTILGGILGVLLHPLINIVIMSVLSIKIPYFTIALPNVGMWLIILSFEFIFMLLSNVGYAYRTELRDLLDEPRKINMNDVRMIKLPVKTYLILYLIGLLLIAFMPYSPLSIGMGSIIGFLGLKGILHYTLPNKLDQLKYAHKNLKAESMLITSGLYSMLKATEMFLLILFGTFLFMNCYIIMIEWSDYLRFVLILGYLLMLFMEGVSCYFKLMMEGAKQQKAFAQLRLIGFITRDLKAALHKQMKIMAGLVLLAPLPYGLLILIKYLMVGEGAWIMSTLVVASYAVVIIITFIAITIGYQKRVLKMEGEVYGEGN